MVHLFIWIFYVIQVNLSYETGDLTDLCSKDYFLQEFVNKEKELTGEVSRTYSSCVPNATCNGVLLNYQLTENLGNNTNLAISSSELSSTSNKGCWGFYFRLSSFDNETRTKVYINFPPNENIKRFSHTFKLTDVGYTFEIISIPTMNIYRGEIINPEHKACHEEVMRLLGDYELNKRYIECRQDLHLKLKEKVVSQICKNDSNSSSWEKLLKQKLKIHAKNCTKSLQSDTIGANEKTILPGGYLKLTKQERKKIYMECGQWTKCFSAELSFHLGIPPNESEYNYIPTISKLKSDDNSECWGFVFVQIEYIDNVPNITTFYLNFFDEKQSNFTWFLPYGSYEFKVVSIPTMLQRDLLTVNASQCEIKVFRQVVNYLQTNLRPVVCGNTEHVEIIRKFARPLCKAYPVAQERDKEINKYFKENFPPCPFTYHLPRTASVQNNPRKDLTLAAIVIPISTLVLFVMAVVVARRIYRCRQHRLPLTLHTKQDMFQSPTEKEQNTTSSTMVMILSRPGCELLEHLLRDLAYILTSYGIKVKLSLLDQHEVDMEGGISSYMQRNLSQCDFILIMFTEENSQETVLPKHRPYEFALRVISGLAYHNNSCSRYIPIYLSNYNDAVNLLPSFLNATTSFGYRIPHDINKLLCRILENNLPKQSKERKIKDDFFISRMKGNGERILKKTHSGCCSLDCNKGQLYESVSNLSSVWPSTIASKYIMSPWHEINRWEENTQIDLL